MKTKMRNQMRFLLLIPFLIGSLFLSSCENNEDVNSNEVQLLSFGPSGVKPGEEISFIGKNLDQVTGIQLPDALVSQGEFLSQSKELIKIKVPMTANEGLVTLLTASEEIVSKTMLSFDVVVSISAMTESVKPGETITISGEYLNWVRAVTFAKDTTVVEFESQTMNELVVRVPFGAETGPLSLNYGGTSAETIRTETELKVILPSLSGFSPNPVKRDENLVIKGKNLDLVQAVFFKGIQTPVSSFVSQSADQIVVAIPEGANKGKISLMAFSGILIESENTLTFVGDLPDLPALAYVLYDDGFENNWQNWGWGNTSDMANGDNVRMGELAAKLTFNGSWGALKFANSSVDLSSYTELTFAIFGEPGTEGKTFNLSANDGAAFEVKLKEGEWTEYKISFEDLGSPSEISTLSFQETGWSGTVYFDHVGLR